MLTLSYTFHEPPTWLKLTQISTHILLLTAVTTSLLLIILPWLQQRLHLNHGKIKLQAEAVAQTRKGLLSKLFLDHIEDIPSDGDPVDLPGFWTKVSIRHSVQSPLYLWAL